jgi:hypothetical protein
VIGLSRPRGPETMKLKPFLFTPLSDWARRRAEKSFLMEAPNSKHQIPNKSQFSKSQIKSFWSLGYWNVEIIYPVKYTRVCISCRGPWLFLE